VTIAPLDQLCEINSGGTPSRANPEFFGGNIPWAKISDIEASNGSLTKTEETITEEGLKAIRNRLFPRGTLLLAIYGSVGKVAFAETSVAANQAILGIRIKDDRQLHGRYLLRYLETQKQKFEADAAGIAQKNLSAAYVRALPIPLPPLAEQKRIAAILDQADNLRRLRQRAIDRLNELGQAIFYEMFGITDLAKSDWRIKSLEAVVRADTIVTYGIVQAGPEFEGGVPYIRTGDIGDGRIETAGLRHTDPEIARRFARSRVEAGEIVMSIRATVGTVALVPSELEGANLTQGTARISPGPEVDRHYLIAFLRSEPAQNWIAQQVKGATFREITLTRLRELPVPIPPIDLQRAFARASLAAQELASRAEKHVLISQNLFSSLQHRAFTKQL
jgi:type I restriction enzyme, S subunit